MNRIIRRTVKVLCWFIALVCGFTQVAFALTDFMSSAPSQATAIQTLLIPSVSVFAVMFLVGLAYPVKKGWIPLLISGALPACLMLVVAPFAGAILLPLVVGTIGGSSWLGSLVRHKCRLTIKALTSRRRSSGCCRQEELESRRGC